MKVLVTGGKGLVGRQVSNYCTSIGDTVVSYDHAGLDITDRDLVSRTLIKETPDAVINCAAWTDVDGCESDEERAYSVNAQGPENLAIACRSANATFLTISTDYVFDGQKGGFYTQLDEPNPESVYAKSKLAGEIRSSDAFPESIVVRTGYVFGPGGNNFLSTIIDRARHGKGLSAINDAYGTPTYSRDLAARIRELVSLNVSGIFHVVNSGPGVTFAEFARTALQLAHRENVNIEEVSMDSLNRPAKRPRNSRMRCLLSEKLGLQPMRDWREALADFVSHA